MRSPPPLIHFNMLSTVVVPSTTIAFEFLFSSSSRYPLLLLPLSSSLPLTPLLFKASCKLLT